ncbi:hypothetical protein NP493_967g00038 [Ridgeia piscesae]|uniref:Ion transport domain-containing protein n=1 Tax=Ridgeia piscesae TaxID=27915 RepID=A0AAD9NKY3_RIDPI|nr:hypothetical protein NP493_967g00038 [Ridgeia piscesae]
MTVFQMDVSDSAREIDLVILQALLKVNKDKSCEKQLKLALTWNRIDIARNEILTEDAKWDPVQLEELMEIAILHDRVDFVKLFLENGITFTKLLTDERILTFYKQTSQMDKYLKDKQKDKCTSKDVASLLEKKLGDCVSVTWGHSGGSDPLLLLFLWAILTDNIELAKLFWEEGKEGIAAALLAQKLLKTMADQVDDPAEHTKLLSHMAFFESLAVGVLTECYVEDERKAQLLLTRDLANFGNKTVLRLAKEADNKLFLANVACQSLLDRIWMGRMALNNGWLKPVVCLFLPPLLFWLITFRDDAWTAISKDTDSQDKSNTMVSRGGCTKCCGEQRSIINPTQTETAEVKVSCWQKLSAFFTAPMIIFAANVTSYLLFLGLFSFILLTDFHDGFTKKEYLLLFWVGTLILEEIRQLVKSGVHRYLRDLWNILDMGTMFIFLVGFLLHWIPTVTTCTKCLEAARIILALDVMLFYLRALHIFSVHRRLGPKLVMIKNMMIDMSYFIVILFVCVTAYGVALQAILYPNSKFTFSLFGNIFKKAYFQIYGELFLEELDGTLACEATPASNSSLPRCPVNTEFVPSILMAVYILFTNVLMLNLLIAMFSYTFNKIQTNTDEHWFFQRYILIKEYHDRPPLAPPVILIYHIYLVFRWGMYRKRQIDSDFHMAYPESLTKELILWENMNGDEYVRRTKAERQQSLENRVRETQER